jgi:hypothetical protein
VSRRRKKRSAEALPTKVSPTAAVDLAEALSRSTGLPVAAKTEGTQNFGSDRTVAIKIVAPHRVLFDGRIANPDQVLQKHGWNGVAFYSDLERAHPVYAGVCNLWADKVCANNLAIKPGDPDDGYSRWMADATKANYLRLPDRHIIDKKAVKGRFIGFSATGKAGWEVDEETGLLVPRDLYDIPQKYLDFKADGTPLVKVEGRADGLPIPQDSVMFFHWGSRFTPWGEADAQFCYLPLYYAQTARQLGMNALELLGRPIPWIEIPDDIQGEQYETLETGLKAQYKYYVITRTTAGRTTVSFPTNNVLASGAAGKSELEYVRYYYGEVYIFVLGVQMTQDKTGGSRALEDSRIEVIADKTPAGLQALGAMWKEGYSDHIWRLNSPKTPRGLWPKWEAEIQADPLDAGQQQQAMTALLNYGLDQITDVVAIRSLQSVGVPRDWAEEMVESMREGKIAGRIKPSSPQRLPQASDVPAAA